MAGADPQASSRIFISYRREDSSGHVLALLPALRRHFGADRIFKDTDNIPAGADFLKFIRRELESCSVLLAVIGRDWLTIQDPRLKCRRLDNPDDFLRVEVASALKSERIRVIPVLVERASMPSAEDLPPDLGELPYRNAVELSDGRWESDVQLLIEAVEKACAQPAAKPDASSQRPELLDLQRRRTREIEAQLTAAREAFAARDFEGTLWACEKALLLDPQRSDALELLDRARRAFDEQKIDSWLREARHALTQGDTGTASDLIDQALSLDHTSDAALSLRKEMLALRRERERERERGRVVRAATDRAQASLDDGDFETALRHADDALAVDPDAAEAQTIRSKASAALDERRRQREHKRRAQQTVADARGKLTAGDPDEALRLLQDFSPPHDLVTAALQELQEAVEAIEQRRRHVDELLRAAADLLAAERFEEAIPRLIEGAALAPERDDIPVLLAEAKARQAEAAAAEAARRQANERLVEAARRFHEQDYQAARRAIEAARGLDPGHPDLGTWLRRVDAALAEQAAAARRSEAIRTALAKARECLDLGDLDGAIRHAGTALGLDPMLREAHGIRNEARAALAERQAREEHERRARETVERARGMIEANDYTTAMELLETFHPPHALVSEALHQAREQFREVELRRQAEEEEAARQHLEFQRAEAERGRAEAIRRILSRARAAHDREDFAAAARDADELLRLDPESADGRELRAAAAEGLHQQMQRHERERLAREAADRARAEAARAAEERRQAEIRKRQEEERAAREAAESARAEAARAAEERRQAAAREREIAEAARQQAALADIVSSIEGHLAEGRLDAAEQLLVEAQRTLPASASIEALRARALELRAQEAERARDARVQQLVADAQSAFESRAFRTAKRKARAALALAPDHEAARALLTSAGRELHAARQVFWSSPRVRGVAAAAAVIVSTVLAIWYYGETAGPGSQPAPDEISSVSGEPTPPGDIAAPVEKPPTQPPDSVTASVPPPVATTPTAEDARRQRLELLRETAQRQLRTGERAEALQSAAEGLQVEPNDPALQSVMDSLLGAAQKGAQQAKGKAVRAGAATHSQKTFAEAVKVEETAIRSRDANRTDTAIQALWRATDLFELAARQANSEQTRLKQLQEDARKQKLAAGEPGRSAQPPDRPEGQAPPAGPPVTPTEDKKAGEQRQPVTRDQASAEAPPKPPVDPIEMEKERITRTLQRYETAYDKLDAAAVKSVYPSVREDLPQLFRQYEFYRLDMYIEKIDVAADRTSATARCRSSHYFNPKVGTIQQFSSREEFRLQKQNDTWVIVQIQRR